MLPTRKSVPRSSRQSDHTKTSWPPYRDANCSGMVLSPVHKVWPNPSCKAQWKGEEEGKTDKGRGGKTHQGMDRPGFRPSTGGSGEQWKWRELVAKSFVVPQRPSRLRDRWDDGRESIREKGVTECWQFTLDTCLEGQSMKTSEGRRNVIFMTWQTPLLKYSRSRSAAARVARNTALTLRRDGGRPWD